MPIQLDSCPNCSGPLSVRVLACGRCGLELHGDLAAPAGGPFAHLSAEQQAFLRLFVTSRGNLSDIERTLGVSYPTVRAKVDDLIAALSDMPPASRHAPPEGVPARVPDTVALPASAPAVATSRREVLEQISSGQITAQEGLARLRQRS